MTIRKIPYLVFASALTLTGCGVAYISPNVQETTQAGSGVGVSVVALTPEIVAAANRVRYKPRSLPAAFFRTSAAPSEQAVAAALPDGAARPEIRPQSLEMTLPPAAPVAPYRIGVADVLLLATPSATSTVEQLSGLLAAQNKRQGYTVQDDGAIAIPDVGRIELSGLTLEEAEAEIFKALVAAGIDPTFSLEISEFNSQRVSIGGAVKTPILAPITLKPLYLEEAVQLAGGVASSDLDFTVIRLFRDGKLYQIPLKRLFADASVKKVRLVDGDTIFVDAEFNLAKAQSYFAEQLQLTSARSSERAQALAALQAEFTIAKSRADEARANYNSRLAADAVQRDYVYLAGEVTTQGRFTLPLGRQANLADALYSQSGIAASTGNPTQIYVLRGNKAGDVVNAYHLDARNIAMMTLATRLELRPNDVVFVAEQPVTKWNRVWTQIVPSIVTAGAQSVVASR